MLQLTRLSPEPGAQVFAKLEFLNPGGSIKDRAALGMILDAESRGLLRPGSTILEATAGNTGVGLALIGVNRGYKVKLFVPEGFAEEKCILMRGFGAEVTRTPESEGMAGAIRRANQAAASIPGSFMAGQFSNQANPQFHHDTTAAEIWEQLDGRIDAFVCGIGTGGTFSGIARFLKERNPRVAHRRRRNGRLHSPGRTSPASTAWKASASASSRRPFTATSATASSWSRDDDAFAMVKRLAAEEGLVAGSSSGANVHAALEIANELGPGKRIATIIPDSAERYLSKKIFDGGM